MPHIDLLIKPSSGMCNIHCDYCFYRDVTEKRMQCSYGFMTLDTLEQVLQKALAFAEEECTIAYQGGEPTLIGLDFFQKSIELQKKHNVHNVKIHNAIQTNGIGLDEDWARFLVENHFLVGLSLDGPKDTHDAFRRDSKGDGTFKQVLETTRLFDRFQVEYNIVTVVTSQTARHAQSIYSFFKKNQFRWLQFIPCLDPLGEAPGQHPYSLTAKAYGDFLKLLFDLWYRDIKAGEYVSIRQFDNYIHLLTGHRPEQCGMSGVCGSQNVVEADGAVYCCDFYVLDEYRLGNLHDCTFEEIYRKRKELRFVENSAAVNEKCRDCRYFPLCRGGCRRYREPELGLNCFCQSYQEFFAYALPRMEELARLTTGRQGF